MIRRGLFLPSLAPVLFGGFKLPYSVDFSTLGDGALPSKFYAPNWAIATGVAVCTPTLGAELIVNGSFAAWTGDNPDNWTIVNGPEDGTNYVAEATGAARIVRDTKQIGISQNPADTYALVFRASRDVTAVTSGTAVWLPNPSAPQVSVMGSLSGSLSAAYSGVKTEDFIYGKTLLTHSIYGNANPSDLTFDDVSLKTVSGMFAFLPATQANATVKAGLNVADLSLAGVIARADSRTNPQNYLVAHYSKVSTAPRLGKVVNGTYTAIATSTEAYAAGAVLELRCNGTTIEVYYNNALKITQTVDEATINNNTIHGAFSPNGGNSLDSFFCIPPS